MVNKSHNTLCSGLIINLNFFKSPSFVFLTINDDNLFRVGANYPLFPFLKLFPTSSYLISISTLQLLLLRSLIISNYRPLKIPCISSMISSSV